MSKLEKNQSTSQNDIFMKPDPDKIAGSRNAVYDKLNEKGFVPEETEVINNDIIIGKVTPIQPSGNSNKVLRDSSEIYKGGEPAIIDKVFTDIYDPEGYQMIKIRTRSERIPKIGDKFACYTDDHDVLTFNGWKNIIEITKEDKVATLVNGNTLVYSKPTEIMNYDFDGELYEVESNQVSLRVTKNHRMYTADRDGKKFDVRNAEDIYGKRRKYKKNVENYNVSDKHPMLEYIDNVPTAFILKGDKEEDNLSIPINDWLYIFGIWMAEGCVTNKGGADNIVIAAHKERVKDKLDESFNNINIKLHKYKDHKDDNINNRHIWCISNKLMIKYLKPLSVGAVNKYLPDWVWHLTPAQCQTLIDGMMLGDGHTMENGTRRYDTSSTQLADDFQKLCFHAGWSTNITIKYKAGKVSVIKKGNREGEIIRSTVDAYRMTIIESQNTPLVNKNIKPNGEDRLDKYVEFKGKVYCCSVGGDGIIYVRRNGYPVWCGNSSHGQKGTIGLTLHQSDMPFTENGVSPDMIVNPNAIPSRMTIAQLLECLVGKVSALKGMEGDGTAFIKNDIEKIKDELEKLGYRRDCREIMYNGFTGQQLQIPIFIGPTYYQRLKHMSSDKIHCLTLDHEVLTLNGWKQYKDLTLDDKIATLNKDTMELEYQNPTKIHYGEYNGKMYHIQSYNIDLKVTDEHRMFVSTYKNNKWSKYDFVFAKDIIGKNVKYLANEVTNGEYNTIEIDCTNKIETFENEQCPVFCVSVPNEIFYVRRNGKPCWTGNSRSRGRRTTLTHQPPTGRTKDGGLKCGEMEKDSIISHGMSKFLKERLLDLSDAYSTYVCDVCGLFAQRMIKKDSMQHMSNSDVYQCIPCKNKTRISKVVIPYAFKLLIQELMSMNIAPRIRTKH